MKAKTIVSTLILSFAAIGAAQAANSEPNNAPFQGVYGEQAISSASRAQIVGELQHAQAAGLTGNSDIDNTPFTPQVDSGVTRAQAAAGVRTGYVIGDLNNQPFQGV